MTKMSSRRVQRRQIAKLARQEAEKLTGAEARKKLAQWAAAGGDMNSIKNQRPLSAPPERRQEAPPTRFNRSKKHGPKSAQGLTIADVAR